MTKLVLEKVRGKGESKLVLGPFEANAFHSDIGHAAIETASSGRRHTDKTIRLGLIVRVVTGTAVLPAKYRITSVPRK